MKPTTETRSSTLNGIARPADLLGHGPEDVPAVEGQEREHVDDREAQRDEPRIDMVCTKPLRSMSPA
jgi:hypothetical protein